MHTLSLLLLKTDEQLAYARSTSFNQFKAVEAPPIQSKRSGRQAVNQSPDVVLGWRLDLATPWEFVGQFPTTADKQAWSIFRRAKDRNRFIGYATVPNFQVFKSYQEFPSSTNSIDVSKYVPFSKSAKGGYWRVFALVSGACNLCQMRLSLNVFSLGLPTAPSRTTASLRG